MSIGSNRRADRTNRIVLTIVGCVAVAAGAGGLLFSYLTATPAPALINPTQRNGLLDHSTTIAAIGAVMILAVAAVVMMWLRHQIQPIPEAGDIAMARTARGTTTLTSDALTDTVAAELLELRGVTTATARIRASDPDTIDVLLDVDDTVQLARVATEARGIVLTRARQATRRDALTLALECRPVAAHASSRVA